MVGTLDEVLAALVRLSTPWPRDRAPSRTSAASCAGSAAWWWPSAAASTRRCWPGGAGHPRAAPRAVRDGPVALAGPPRSGECRALADEWDLRWVGVPTDEMEDAAYVANGPDRCARCKTALMDALGPARRRRGRDRRPRGQRDDLGDHRPGQAAAAAGGRRFPLVEAGFTKDDIRHWSRALGLRTWDKPAAACLASRLPYGTPVTLGRLGAVEAPRRRCARSGSASCACATTATRPAWRSRPTAWPRWWPGGTRSSPPCARPGFRFVALDLEGFRSGSLNRVLCDAEPGRSEPRRSGERRSGSRSS